MSIFDYKLMDNNVSALITRKSKNTRIGNKFISRSSHGYMMLHLSIPMARHTRSAGQYFNILGIL